MNKPEIGTVYGLLYLPTGKYIMKSYGKSWLNNLLRALDKRVPWAVEEIRLLVPEMSSMSSFANYNFEIIHLPNARSINDGDKV